MLQTPSLKLLTYTNVRLTAQYSHEPEALGLVAKSPFSK